MQIKIDDVIVRKRARRELTEIDSLADSMQRYGLLNPITINSQYELIAGRRRLEAAKRLGWVTIEASIVDAANEAKAFEMEIEENVQRSPFTDDELLEAYKRLETLRNPNFLQRVLRTLRDFFKKLLRSLKTLFSRAK